MPEVDTDLLTEAAKPMKFPIPLICPGLSYEVLHPSVATRTAGWPGRIAMLLIGVAASLVACGGCTSAAGDVETTKTEVQELPTLVAEILPIAKSRWPTIVRTQGSVMADEVAVIGAKVAGRVAQVHVDLGDSIKTGDPLVSLDQNDFQLQVEQADAQFAQACAAVGLQPGADVSTLNPQQAPPVRQENALWNEAKANLERAQQLRQQNAITAAELEQIAAAERVAEARYASALNSVNEKIALIGVRKAELGLARQRLEDAVIRAPFDGLVRQRQVAPGGYVQIGDAIATIVRTNPLRFRGTLPERHAQKLAIGQEVRLTIESVPEPRLAAVTRISPSLDEMSRGLMFEAEVDNSDSLLRTGLFAEAEVVLDASAQAVVVPQSAVIEFAGAEKVWKVTDGVAGEQVVETGLRRGDRVEILGGLSTGDEILLDATKGRVARIDVSPNAITARAIANDRPFAEGSLPTGGEDEDDAAQTSSE